MDTFRTSFKFRFDNTLFQNPIILNDFILYQLGDLFCEHDTVVDDHKQDMQLEFSFIERGKGTMTTNGVPLSVTAEHIYLSLKDDVHSVVSDKFDTLRYFYFAIDIKATSQLYPISLFLQEQFKDEKKRLFYLPYVFPQVTNMLSELTYDNEYSNNLIESNLTQIVVSFYRSLSNTLTPSIKHNSNEKNSIIYNIANYIANNVTSIISLKQLSDRFAYDYAYISRKFKSVMGTSMNDYFQETKMIYAKNLLMYEEMTVTKVAEVLNYISVNNFSRAFKNHFGVPPTDFTKK